MTERIAADYLIVGEGAAAMAFADWYLENFRPAISNLPVLLGAG